MRKDRYFHADIRAGRRSSRFKGRLKDTVLLLSYLGIWVQCREMDPLLRPGTRFSKVPRTFRAWKLFYVCRVCTQDQSFNNQINEIDIDNEIISSVNKAKLTGLWARNCGTIQLVLISKFTFGPEKLSGLSRNGPSAVSYRLSSPDCGYDHFFIWYFFIVVYIPQVFYVEEGETLFFLSLSPKEDVVVNTYTSHTWFVKDLDTNKILHVNGHKKYIPVKTDPENPIRVFITVPSWW